MSDFERGNARSIPQAGDMSIDAGLRAFMLGVYNKMMVGLLLAGGLAWVFGTVQPVAELLVRVNGTRLDYTPLGLIVAFAPLAIIIFSNFFLRNLTPRTSGILYWSLVSLIGASLGTVFMVYNLGSIASAFLITATGFGALSLFGYATKRDLSGFRSFLIMGAWGIIGAGVASFFLGGLGSNPVFFFLFNIAGVLIFSGLVAWKTQELKVTYYAFQNDQVSLAVATNYGALNLFISFINLFQFVLALMGGRRN